mmetsp:Transcript_27326/g.41562  ORF Transcript_27326/g.41562 Transcript_27326/m.41562 type:complete len:131 (+) Transcript_27326:104-496(+)
MVMDATQTGQRSATWRVSKAEDFKLTPEDFRRLCSLDNRLTEGNEALATDLVKDSLEYPERVLSSKILLTEMGGPMGLARALSSNPNSGISATQADVLVRQKVYGRNSFPVPAIKTVWELILENFEDPIN